MENNIYYKIIKITCKSLIRISQADSSITYTTIINTHLLFLYLSNKPFHSIWSFHWKTIKYAVNCCYSCPYISIVDLF